MESTALTMCKR
jgi:superfamily II DNA helicase RecQ